MIIRIKNGLTNILCSVEDKRLTKKYKSEIIEKYIDKQENLNLSQLCNLRNSSVEKLSKKDLVELNYCDPDYEFVVQL